MEIPCPACGSRDLFCWWKIKASSEPFGVEAVFYSCRDCGETQPAWPVIDHERIKAHERTHDSIGE